MRCVWLLDQFCLFVLVIQTARANPDRVELRITRDGSKPLSLFLSIQVEVTTTGAAHCLPTIRPCGPVAPAGTAWEDAAPAPPRLPPLVRASPPPLQGPSTATAWGVLTEWMEGAFVSGAPVPLRPRAATSTTSTQTRRSPSSLPPLLLRTLFTFPTPCFRATSYPGGTAGLCRWSCPTCCRSRDPRTLFCRHTPRCPP